MNILQENVATSVDMRIKNLSTIFERIEKNTNWGIRRFENKKDYKAQLKADVDGEILKPYTEREELDLFGIPQMTIFNGNLTLNEGINEMFTIFASASSGTKFDNTNAYLGVGDSNTAEAASQTGLQASTNKAYVAMDVSYPTYGTSQQAVWKSTFGLSTANFAWNEFTLANGNSDSSVNFNRKVSSQGTKQADQIWELTQTASMS